MLTRVRVRVRAKVRVEVRVRVRVKGLIGARGSLVHLGNNWL